MKFEKEYALIGATLIDGNGGSPIENTTIIVNNERIEKLENRDVVDMKDNLQRVDISGHYLMPGLIDVHYLC